jgi:hypothetical protein
VIVLDSEHQIPISAYVAGASTMWTKLNGRQEINLSHARKSFGFKKTVPHNQQPQNLGHSTTNVTGGDDIPDLDSEWWEDWAESMGADFQSGDTR